MARFQPQSDRVGEIMSDDNSDISSLTDEELLEESSSKSKSATSTNRQNKLAPPQRSSSEHSMSSSQSEESVDSDEIKDKRTVSVRVHQRPKDRGNAHGKSSLTKKNSKKWYSDSDDNPSDDDNPNALVNSSKKSHITKDKVEVEEIESPIVNIPNKSRSSKSTKEEEPHGEAEEEDDDDSDLEKFISGVVAQKKKSIRSSKQNTKEQEEQEPQLKRLSETLGKKKKSIKEKEEKENQDEKKNDSYDKNSKKNKIQKPIEEEKPQEEEEEKEEEEEEKKKKEVKKPQLILPQALSSPPLSTTTKPLLPGQQPERKKSSFQNLMAKTRLLSPFGSSRKKSDFGGEMTSPTGSETSVSTIGTGQRIEIQKTYNNGPFHHRSSTKITSPTTSDTSESNLNSITTSPPIKDGPNKRLARLQQAFLSGESSTLLPSSSSSSSSNNSNTNTNAHLLPPATMEPKILEVLAEANRRGSEIENVSSTLSPSQRKTPGAFVGRNGSGVLLEGWLRQKQRRGIKGMKKWNSRYFVLYAKSNEIRYYTDVVQSAWGPIPLGEIGSISLRLIQRIGKPSHPKYKGCRFDITCRNSWGTHYAEDFISSDEEDEKTNTNTPNASRVYSLMADCPQTAVLWVNMLDSLLVRSANSPRPDMASTSSSSSAGNTPTTTTTNSTTTMTTTTMTSALKKMSSMKNSTTSSSSTNTQKKKKKNPSVNFDLENRIFTAPGEIVPKAVVYSMKYIFDSTPGIETESFYERDPDSNKLKNAIQFLNQFALEENTTKLNKKLSMDELENVLDPITGGAIIKLWLQQMEQPIIPFEMYPDFLSLAKEVKIAPFELQRNLKTLIAALPQKNLKMLACLLFHLTEVSVYANKNGMDAGILAELFSHYVLRSSGDDEVEEEKDSKKKQIKKIVEEMIAHVDTIIDEKEAEL